MDDLETARSRLTDACGGAGDDTREKDRSVAGDDAQSTGVSH
jgi:hypothetical protein